MLLYFLQNKLTFGNMLTSLSPKRLVHWQSILIKEEGCGLQMTRCEVVRPQPNTGSKWYIYVIWGSERKQKDTQDNSRRVYSHRHYLESGVGVGVGWGHLPNSCGNRGLWTTQTLAVQAQREQERGHYQRLEKALWVGETVALTWGTVRLG